MPRDEMLGKTVHDVFPPEEANRIAQRDERLLQSEEQFSVDEHPLDTPRNGRRIVTSKRVVIRSKDGKGRYLLGFIEDVTELRQPDRQTMTAAPTVAKRKPVLAG